MSPATTDTRLSRADLEHLVTAAFTRANTAPQVAAQVAEALVQAEIDGQRGHGLSRIASYTAQSASGKIDGHAEARLAKVKAATCVVDAAGGFAYPAINLAIAALPEMAADCGIAAAAITRSHHAGAVGWHVERLAATGQIAMLFANTPKAIAPWGGAQPLFGTNPIAFAAPRRNGPPIVVDMALSKVARGTILTAAQQGKPIPADWATDVDGQPTTDANRALAGTLAPIGDAKGAALALMVELLAASLGAANFATEATSFFEADGGPPNVGQLLIAIDPVGFMGRERVLDRIETMAALFHGNGDARLPGSRKADLRASASRDGVAVTAEILAQLQKDADQR